MLNLSRNPEKLNVNSIEQDEILNGVWWTATNPNEKISGTLSLKVNEGIRLHLIGSFKMDLQSNKLASHEIILGEIVPGGALVTIVDCREYQRHIVTETTSSQKFEAMTAVFGMHGNNKSDLSFANYEFSCTYLIDWLHPELIENVFANGITLKDKPNDVVIVPYENALVKFLSCCKYRNDTDYSQGFKQFSWVDIELKEGIQIDNLVQRFLFPLINLIQFASGYSNTVTFIQGFKNNKHHRIIYATEFSRVTRSKYRVNHNMLFIAKRIDGHFSSVVSNWLLLNQKNPHFIDLYFSSAQLGDRFTITRFLLLEQAVESFHTQRDEQNDKTPTPFKTEFIANRLAVLQGFEEKSPLYEWLNQRLNYLPELKVRLNELIEDCGAIVDPLVYSRDKFLKRLVHSRNYYTHYNPKLKKKAATGFELGLISHCLRLLLNYHLLFTLGLPKDSCQEIILESQYYRDLLAVSEQHQFWN